MASWFALKKVLAPTTTRSAIPFRPLARGFAASFSDVYDQDAKGRIVMGVIKSVPHSLCRVTRLIPGHGEIGINVNQKATFYVDGVNTNIIIPGIDKTKVTNEGIFVFLNLGLNHDDDTFDDHVIETTLNLEIKALFYKCFLQIQDNRRYYYGRVNLPNMINGNMISRQSIKTEIKDGQFMVTIPFVTS